MDNKEIADGIHAISKNVDQYKAEVADLKTINRQLQEAVETIQKKNGKITSSGFGDRRELKDVLAQMFTKNIEKIRETENRKADLAFESKDFTISGSLTGGAFQSNIEIAPLFPQWAFHLANLISTINVPTGSVNIPVQTYPSTTGSFGFNTEAATKANVNLAVTNKLVALKYLAAYTRVSKEASMDLPYLTGLLAQELQEMFLQQLDSIVVTAILANATAGSSGASVSAEKLIDNMLQLVTAGHTPNAIIASTSSWATLIRTKPNDYGLPGGYQYDQYGNLVFAGLPVYVSNAVAQGKVIIGDFNRGIKIFQAEGLSLQMTEFSTNPATGVSDFIQNMRTWRMEARLQPVVVSNDSFVYASI